MKKQLKIVFLAGESGGDYFALEKARELRLVDFKRMYMFASSEKSKALRDFANDNKGYFAGCLPNDKGSFFRQCFEILKRIDFDYVLLCGFTYLLPGYITGEFKNKIINSHHSLLPAYPGLYRKERLIKSDDKMLGATLHFVDNGIDSGRKLYQAVFPNRGIKNLRLILKKYRFIQDVMIVQLVRDFSGYRSAKRINSYQDILFSPSVDKMIIDAFARLKN